MIDRYKDDIIKTIWSDPRKFDIWYKIEMDVATCNAHIWGRELSNWKEIDFEKDNVLSKINELEKETKHDVAAFVRFICENNSENSKFIHSTMTSSDLVDTHLSYCIKKSSERIVYLIENLLDSIGNKLDGAENVLIIGRTHGKHATMTTLDHKLNVHASIFHNCWRNIYDEADKLRVKLSGPVGIGSIVHSADQSYYIANMLDLEDDCNAIDSQVINRAWYFNIMAGLLKLSNVLNSFATDLRLLNQEEIGEFVIGREDKQWGSSSMPHKINPVMLERVCGLNRIVRGDFNAFIEGMTLWNERDISNSSVERVVIPDIFHSVAQQLKDVIYVLNNGEFDKKRIKHNFLNASISIFSNYMVCNECIDNELSYTEAVSKVRSMLNNKYKGLKIKDCMSDVYDSDPHILFIRAVIKFYGYDL